MNEEFELVRKQNHEESQRVAREKVALLLVGATFYSVEGKSLTFKTPSGQLVGISPTHSVDNYGDTSDDALVIFTKEDGRIYLNVENDEDFEDD
jgi:hypothetical protein